MNTEVSGSDLLIDWTVIPQGDYILSTTAALDDPWVATNAPVAADQNGGLQTLTPADQDTHFFRLITD